MRSTLERVPKSVQERTVLKGICSTRLPCGVEFQKENMAVKRGFLKQRPMQETFYKDEYKKPQHFVNIFRNKSVRKKVIFVR